jgi:hypothetical protein
MAVAPRMVITSNHTNSPAEAAPKHLLEFCAQNNVIVVDLQTDGMTTLRFLPTRLEVDTHFTQRSITLEP